MKRTLTIILIALLCMTAVFAQSVVETSAAEDAVRIVSLGPNVTEIIYALGAGDQLVGRTDYCNYPEQVYEVASIGTLWEPNIEAVLALDADIAIASSIVDPSFIESLNKAGITAYQFYEEESLDGTYTLIEKVAEVIGKQAEAAELTASMKTRINAVEEKTSTIAQDARKSVIYMISYGDWGDYAATGDTYLDGVIKAAGAINGAEAGAYWSISRELLFAEDPDVIILSAYSWSDPAYEIATFSSTEPYSQLTASKTGNVYTINGDAAERQGVRTVDTIEEIAKLLYPELF